MGLLVVYAIARGIKGASALPFLDGRVLYLGNRWSADRARPIERFEAGH